MNKNKRLCTLAAILAVVIFASAVTVFANSGEDLIPNIVEKDGRHALLVDGKPFLILGGQAHNSSAWPGMLPTVWQAIDALHANTLEVPIYWEQIEAQPGKFDFSLIDTLLVHARQRNVRLVLLWFATWKNGSNHYMPEWMKKQAVKYPNITGKDGNPVDSPSPHTRAAMELDTQAFVKVMEYLKKADRQHTVIMVQVENEPGSWGSVRDFSPVAEKLIAGPVPPELLKPEILKELNRPVNSKGTWRQVFGDDADEYFQAWSIAGYIGYVAAAGKAVNPLPLFTNASLRDPLTNPPATTYESGGPTDNVLAIWKAAAPVLDLLAPDIYLRGCESVLKVIDLYARPDNALFVPEIGIGAENARYFYSVLAKSGIGFSPFGIDDNGRGETVQETVTRLGAVGQEYAMVTPMMREMAQWAFDGKIHAVMECEDHAPQSIDLGAWKAIVSFRASRRGPDANQDRPLGKAMIVKLGESEFLLMGTFCHFTFEPQGANAGKAWQYLQVEEGAYDNGVFKRLRIRNGDETDWGGPSIGPVPAVLHTTLTVR
ncbi:MAG TPA: DUF5597 domain-containing protein [bacterium]|mgnify:CR=1 FL=1|nr:DUF5597 domain-containing protein [bacterium]HPN42003.1 DUF5597 domain-containing protein [bacterium]